MRIYRTSFFVVPIAIILAIFFHIQILNSQTESSLGNELLVKYKNSPQIVKIPVPAGSDIKSLITAYKKDKNVVYAEPNYIVRASIMPSDPFFTNQWYLQKIKATQAWNEVTDAPNKIIAIIDSGVQIDHPDLKRNIWTNSKEIADNLMDDDHNGFVDDAHGYDFVNDSSDPSPKFQEGYTEAGILHGTIIAGVIAAEGNNAVGVTGILWKAKIMPLKVLDDKGEGNTLNVVRAVDYAIANGANVINFSFTGFDYSQSLSDAIKRAKQAGIIVVAAAGNEEGGGEGYFLDNTPMYPACDDGDDGSNWVIGVAASDTLDQKATFSSFGTKCIDIVAPGISFFSTSVYSPNKYYNGKSFNKYYDGFWAGTSMATPIISASVALIEAANPSLNREQVIRTLLDNADDISKLNPKYVGQLGKGRVNLAQAIISAKNQLNLYKVNLAVTPNSLFSPKVKITDTKGKVKTEFLAFSERFKGGINIASGKLKDNDDFQVIAAPLAGGGPQIKIFDSKGFLLGQFMAFAPSFRGGVNVAAGDIDGDGVDEIITSPASNGGPQVKVFRSNGKLISQFMAFAPSFRGGVRLATGNFSAANRNFGEDIVAAAGPSGTSHIRIFSYKGELKGQFMAFSDNFKGGTFISTGDYNNDGYSEIAAAAGPGGGPHVRIYDSRGVLWDSFYAYPVNFSGGVRITSIKESTNNN